MCLEVLGCFGVLGCLGVCGCFVFLGCLGILGCLGFWGVLGVLGCFGGVLGYNNNNNQYIYKQRQSHAMSQRRWLATAVIFRPSDMSLDFAET